MPPKKPVVDAPPVSTLTVGMRAADVVRWAAQHGVEDLLALPLQVVAHADLSNWLRYTYGQGWTIGRVLAARPPRYESTWSAEPPMKAIEAVMAWIHRAAAITAQAAPYAPDPVSDPRLAPVAARLDSAIRAQTRRSGPPLVNAPFTPTLVPPDAVLSLVPGTPTGCSPRGAPFRIDLEAPVEAMVTCECEEAPPSCRARVAALRWTRDALAEPGGALAAKVAERIEMPTWRRTIALLDARPAKEPEGELGWAIDLRRGLEIRGLVCKRAKTGALKTAYLDKADIAAQRARSDVLPVDRVVLDMLPSLSGSNPDSTLLHIALRALIGHPRLFDAETRAPRTLAEVPFVVRLDLANGGVAVSFAVGDQVFAPGAVPGLLLGGNRFLVDHPDGVRISEVLPAAIELARVLYARGAVLPREAVPDLLRHLGTARLPVRVDPDLGVLRRPGEARPVVRIEAGTAPLLRVQVRTRPHPSVGLCRPGDASVGLVGREGAAYLLIDRDPADELAAAGALTARLGLPEEPEWAWGIDDPEAAIALVAALRDAPDATVEWGGRRPDLRDATGKNVRVEIGKGTDWFGVGGALEIAGATVPLATLLEAMRSGRTWVRAEGDVWVRVEERLRERLRALADATDAQGRIAKVHAGAVQALEDQGAAVDAPPLWAEGMDRMRAAATLTPVLPATLRADLRPYQLEGFAWMTRLLAWAGGAVLADDMGLGKTVQALAVLLDRAARGPQLVVAPMSVGFNWLREAERFAPSLRVHLHHGTSRKQDLAHLSGGDLVVTTWDILVRDEALRGLTWATVVFDEAQAMKNADTQRAKSAAALQADARIALTGTPIENRLSELWSLFGVVVPGLLGSAAAFRGRFATPIERDGDTERRLALARMVRPFLLRRMKSQVASDLPPRTEVRVDVELGPDERRRYEAVRVATLQALASDDGPKEQLRFRVLAALTRLRQIACAARLVDDAAPPRSAKIDRLLELLTELREEGRRVLVFSQFAELIRHVRPLVEAEGFRVCHLDGGTPAAQRRAEVDRFQAGEADVFLISLKAGGTGLNLTAASEVVLLDPWWNPAVEDQAADRTHRIGQVQAVTVYRLVARQTVEDGILALHGRKRDLAGAVLEGTGDSGALGVDELVALLAGEEAPARGKAKGAAVPKTVAAVGAVAPVEAVAAPSIAAASPIVAAPKPVAAPVEAVAPVEVVAKARRATNKLAAGVVAAPVVAVAPPEAVAKPVVVAPVEAVAPSISNEPAEVVAKARRATKKLAAGVVAAPVVAVAPPEAVATPVVVAPSLPDELAHLAFFEAALRARFMAGEVSISLVHNTINPLRRLLLWAGTLAGAEAQVPGWLATAHEIPASDHKLIQGAIRKLRAWEAEA